MAAEAKTGWFRVSRMAAANDKQVADVEVSDSMTVDGELYAINACYEQIVAFDEAARARIFMYLYSRLGPRDQQ